VFVGYIYSFIAALLLSLVCTGYAASGIIAMVKKELKKESSKTVVVFEKDDNKRIFFEKYTDCFEATDSISSESTGFPDTVPDFFKNRDVPPVKKIPKSNCFSRPPPCYFI
jgi:hypothetical protein